MILGRASMGKIIQKYSSLNMRFKMVNTVLVIVYYNFIEYIVFILFFPPFLCLKHLETQDNNG